jgi:hypothetical protein
MVGPRSTLSADTSCRDKYPRAHGEARALTDIGDPSMPTTSTYLYFGCLERTRRGCRQLLSARIRSPLEIIIALSGIFPWHSTQNQKQKPQRRPLHGKRLPQSGQTITYEPRVDANLFLTVAKQFHGPDRLIDARTPRVCPTVSGGAVVSYFISRCVISIPE